MTKIHPSDMKAAIDRCLYQAKRRMADDPNRVLADATDPHMITEGKFTSLCYESAVIAQAAKECNPERLKAALLNTACFALLWLATLELQTKHSTLPMRIFGKLRKLVDRSAQEHKHLQTQDADAK